MKKLSLEELEKYATELMLMEKMIGLMPVEEMTLTLEEGDKREIGEIDLSENIPELQEIIGNTLESIAEKMDEIYKNAVDDRESYPEESMAERALWLDDVELSVDGLRNNIRER